VSQHWPVAGTNINNNNNNTALASTEYQLMPLAYWLVICTYLGLDMANVNYETCNFGISIH